MPRRRLIAVTILITAIVASAVAVGVAIAAGGVTSGSYAGQTKQRDLRPHRHRAPLKISFRIRTGSGGNAVTGLTFDVNDTCPDGHTLEVHSFGYPPIQITGSAFGGSFGVANGKPGEGSTISATISGRTVTGTLSDAGWSRREHKLCRGKTTFKAQTAA